jgi:hypothetical protein
VKLRRHRPTQHCDSGRRVIAQALGDEAYPNGLGLFPITDHAESSIQSLRSGALGMSNQAMCANLTPPDQAETQQETLKESLDPLRKQIERHGRTHEQSRRLAHGTVNRAVYSQFRKSRVATTEPELHKVMKWMSKAYPL